MTPIEAFVLALIQGITEFLPISSSAHLILVPWVLGWSAHDLRFDIVTNAGTLLAAVVYFRHDLIDGWRSWRRRTRRPSESATSPPGSPELPGLLPAVVAASIPVLVVGFLYYDWFATGARRPELIAFMSIAFGLLLWWADRIASRSRQLTELSWGDSLAIGLGQAIALIPGTSRSGVTITLGLALGFRREDAARFSFLLAIPVGGAAVVHDLLTLATSEPSQGALLPLFIGFVVSALSAYLVIGWLLAWLQRQDLSVFVVYRVLFGVVILALAAWDGP